VSRGGVALVTGPLAVFPHISGVSAGRTVTPPGPASALVVLISTLGGGGPGPAGGCG